MASNIDLQPLTSVTSRLDTEIQNNNNDSFNTGSMSLCVLIETDQQNQLVIISESFGTASAKHLTKVKTVQGDEIKEVEEQRVKILQDLDKSKMDIDIFEVVDEIVKINNPGALRLAVAQDIVSTNTRFTQSDGNSIIHHTALNGTTECLQYLLNEVYEQFPFDLKNDKGFTILHCAVQGGNNENVGMILNFIKSDDKTSQCKEKIIEFLHAKSKLGNNALHLCAVYDKPDPIRPLLRAGTKLSEGDSNRNTLIHLAAERNSVEYFKRIAMYHNVDRAADKDEALREFRDCFQLQNKERKIPVLLAEDRPIIEGILKYSDITAEADEDIGSLIHVTAVYNNIGLAQALVKRNVKLDVVNKIGVSPLKYAAKRGSGGVLRILLDNKANPNYIGEKIRGYTALNIAVQFGQFGCAKILMDYGADVYNRDMTHSALHSAATGGHAKIAKYLIKVAGMNVNQFSNGETALHLCITKGNNSVARLLILHGADVNVLDYEKDTLLHIAVREGRKEIAAMLLEAGIKSDEQQKNGITPLMLAVEADRADFIPLIIARGFTLSKKDEDGNTVIHHIAKNNSCSSAKYFLPNISGMKLSDMVNEIFEKKNVADKTPYEIALECKHQPILKIFINYAAKDYYKKRPKEIHSYYDLKLFQTLKVVINKSIEEDEHRGEVLAETIIFDSNEDGKYPDDSDFKPLKPSFLHKLLDCPDQELKYHPIFNIIIDKKLRIYRWWYVVSLLFYSFFLACLGYALIQASTQCDATLWVYANPVDWVRAVCEVISLFYLGFFLMNEFVEFFIEWIRICDERKDGKEDTGVTVKYITDSARGDNTTLLVKIFICWHNFTNLFHVVDVKSRFFFSAFQGYFDGVYNFLDWFAIISFVILIILRAISSHIQWSFAGLTFIFFSLSLFKYTRISPELGAYVSSVFRIFILDIPRFFILIVIILVAYIGGIHLAARQQPISEQDAMIESMDGSESLPYAICNTSRSAFFWFNSDLTSLYDLRRPLLSGIILLLDGGPGNYEDDILTDNFFFTLIYLGFAFTIIIVMLNILIAQLSETYGEIIKESSFHYKIDLVVTLENKSNLAFLFGKRFRKYTAIESLKISLPYWKQLKDESPNRSGDQVILDTNEDLKRTEKMIEKEFEKTITSIDDLNNKVNELRYRLDEYIDFVI
ncbi:Ankyrin repeat protein [Oopsacas minuta]|uniref:Ankyrin repeat protein n=1 Tax=Oopsacas minuta TaxID=111878 RepID=A0AAV7JKX7_9METZ|nr:Ankyrin repeat protein [Oopsacas minuta]